MRGGPSLQKKERMSLWFVMLIISIWFASFFCLMALKFLFCLWVTSASMIVKIHPLRSLVPIFLALILFVNSFVSILRVISISERCFTMKHEKMIARLIGFMPDGHFAVLLRGEYQIALKGRVKKPVRDNDAFIWVYPDPKTGWLVRTSDPK